MKSLSFLQPKARAVSAPLLLAEVPAPKSVFAACIKASAQAINEALGCTDATLLDEYLQTDGGKKWQEGLRGYAAHVVCKVPDVVV